MGIIKKIKMKKIMQIKMAIIKKWENIYIYYFRYHNNKNNNNYIK